MEKNHMEKYKDIIININDMDIKDAANNSWYSDQYYCPAVDKLKEKFPNIEFSIKDLLTLAQYAKTKKDNDNVIYDLADSKYGHSFEESHGHMKTQEEKYKYNDAKENKEKIDSEYNKAFSTFFEICENLNEPEKIKDSEFDIEKNVFEPMYDYKFESSSKDAIIKKFYDKYKGYRQSKEQNEELVQANQELRGNVVDLQVENAKLKEDNDLLKDKNISLQRMLSRTLDFCEHVRNSRVGSFFFRKQIKGLPAPEKEDNER